MSKEEVYSDEMVTLISEAIDNINRRIFENEEVKKYNSMSYEVVKVIIENSVKEVFMAGLKYLINKIERMRKGDD